MSETIDSPSAPQPLSKLEIAKRHLDRAVLLFLDEKDFVCAITLAGAAEEVFAQLLLLEGGKTSADEWIDTTLAVGNIENTRANRQEIRGMLNWHRNELKHHGGREGDEPEDEVVVHRGDAVEVLDRAVDNYVALTGDRSDLILRYQMEVDQD